MSQPKLLDRVRDFMILKNYSPRTIDVYLLWIRHYILFHQKKHPLEMGADHVRQFLNYLAQRRHVSASTQNQAFNALIFLYKHILQTDLGPIGETLRARRTKRLPDVLTRNEVTSVLTAMDGTPQLVASLLYGAGLRLMEGHVLNKGGLGVKSPLD